MMLDVVRLRSISIGFFVCLLAAFVGGIFYKIQERGQAFLYSVDFTGGTQLVVRFGDHVRAQQVDAALEKEFSGSTTREFSDKEILIRVQAHKADTEGVAGRVKQLLQEHIGTSVEIAQIDSVGAEVSDTLSWQSIVGVLIALGLMLAYIGTRFWAFSYAAASVISLIHDVLVMLTVVIWFDYEISMNIISAVLFILGYSINDTIVIFSRIRENIQKYSKESLASIVNLSVNQTLRRTVLTSIATCLVVVALLAFGGETLRTLSLALLIGMIFGTYSSIFIASPVMMALYRS